MGDTQREEHSDETKEQKKARKREKKEAKKRKRQAKEVSHHQSSFAGPSEKLVQPRPPGGSILSSKKLRLSASILPSGLRDVKSSIDKCMSSFMLKYSEAIGGVIMAYNNVQIMTNGSGRIVEELPHIHYDVTCDALVFDPFPKAKLTGRVTGSFHSHLSLVVFDYFNASISASHLRAKGFEYDPNSDLWYEIKSEYVIEKSSLVGFEIDTVHEASKL